MSFDSRPDTGAPDHPNPGAAVTVVASPKAWIESDAVDQCHDVAALPGMSFVAGMADLHPGKGAPIGCAATGTVVYPHLVGSDIGCGIGVWPFQVRRPDPERIARRIVDLDAPLTDDDPALAGLDPAVWKGHPAGLGTCGRGNHFAEIARVEAPTPGFAQDQGQFDQLGVRSGDLVLIVHSGSRGYGEAILRAHTDIHGNGPAPDPATYLADHDAAVQWARTNRLVIARRVAASISGRLGDRLLDQCHNSVTATDSGYLHRKGAAPGDQGPVLVAGTRGTRSYIVAGDAGPEANWSIPHGAGRKRSRRDAYAKSEAAYTASELRRTSIGSIVVCGDRQLLFEETPDSYKRIETVITDLVAFGQGTVMAATVPIVSYKTADGASTSSLRQSRRQQDRGRTLERRGKRGRR